MQCKTVKYLFFQGSVDPWTYGIYYQQGKYHACGRIRCTYTILANPIQVTQAEARASLNTERSAYVMRAFDTEVLYRLLRTTDPGIQSSCAPSPIACPAQAVSFLLFSFSPTSVTCTLFATHVVCNARVCNSLARCLQRTRCCNAQLQSSPRDKYIYIGVLYVVSYLSRI